MSRYFRRGVQELTLTSFATGILEIKRERGRYKSPRFLAANWTSLIRCRALESSSCSPAASRGRVTVAIPIVINCRGERDNRTEQPIPRAILSFDPRSRRYRVLRNQWAPSPGTFDHRSVSATLRYRSAENVPRLHPSYPWLSRSVA